MLAFISSSDAPLAAAAVSVPIVISAAIYLVARVQRPAVALRRRVTAAPSMAPVATEAPESVVA